MITPKNYTDNFYQTHLDGAITSAEMVIPIVLEYVKPISLIDVGCGIGAWLSVWKKNGVNIISGIDGDYVDTSKLLIEKSEFRAFNLENGFASDKKYDLVTCLEVAEHLAEKHAQSFIASLCMLGDVVLFSAAVPGQRGTEHRNEQYPAYWAKLFATQGFRPIDCIRLKIWNNTNVKWWYRQNILFFVKEDSLVNYPLLASAAIQSGKDVKTLIHPELLENLNSTINNYEKVLNEYEYLLKSPAMTLKHTIKTIFNRENNKQE